jgi:hypothetical protein
MQNLQEYEAELSQFYGMYGKVVIKETSRINVDILHG